MNPKIAHRINADLKTVFGRDWKEAKRKIMLTYNISHFPLQFLVVKNLAYMIFLHEDGSLSVVKQKTRTQ